MVDLVLSQVTLLPEAVAADGADEGLLQPAVLDLLVVHQPCSQHNIIYTPDLCHSALSFDSFSIPFVDVKRKLKLYVCVYVGFKFTVFYVQCKRKGCFLALFTWMQRFTLCSTSQLPKVPIAYCHT